MDVDGLRAFRSEVPFHSWEGEVDDAHIAASRESIARLIDELLALGEEAEDAAIEGAIRAAVQRFNELDESDDGPWIMTIEAEDIAEVLWRIADLTGLDYDDEDLLSDRDW